MYANQLIKATTMNSSCTRNCPLCFHTYYLNFLKIKLRKLMILLEAKNVVIRKSTQIKKGQLLFPASPEWSQATLYLTGKRKAIYLIMHISKWKWLWNSTFVFLEKWPRKYFHVFILADQKRRITFRIGLILNSLALQIVKSKEQSMLQILWISFCSSDLHRYKVSLSVLGSSSGKGLMERGRDNISVANPSWLRTASLGSTFWV